MYFHSATFIFKTDYLTAIYKQTFLPNLLIMHSALRCQFFDEPQTKRSAAERNSISRFPPFPFPSNIYEMVTAWCMWIELTLSKQFRNRGFAHTKLHRVVQKQKPTFKCNMQRLQCRTDALRRRSPAES